MAAEGLMAKLAPYAVPVVQWFANEIGTVGYLLVQSALVVILAALMYANGEAAASALKKWGGGWPARRVKRCWSCRLRPFAAWRWASASLPRFRVCSAASAWRSPACPTPGC